MERVIVHVDMDAFYASVEQRDNPALRGKPVIVGAPKDAKRGVVSTCSYEARKFGVRSAMPIAKAVSLCPDGIYLVPDMKRYIEVSQQIQAILYEFTPVVEQVSIDEAFLDMTGCMHFHPDEETLGRRIKERIKAETSLTASVGISVNKLLAKLASDAKKPDGLVVVRPDQIESFLSPMPLRNLYGIGERSASALRKYGLRTVADVRKRGPAELERILGDSGRRLYLMCLGLDDRPVCTDSETKSISHETTFQTDICGRSAVLACLANLILDVGSRLRKARLRARTLTIKLRYSEGFETITRSRTLKDAFDDDDTIYSAARSIVMDINLNRPIRLVGIGVTNLTRDYQPSLWADEDERKLTRVLDSINHRYGKHVVFKGRSFQKPEG
ncbi:MAG: DNA polymerase IV [Bacillota bacterium]